MEDNLTREQRMAVENRGGKLLVSAAAGSGKTKVLVDRLLLYIMDPAAPCNIDDFLIITYTKAAAAELRGKIAAKLSEHLAEDPENRHLQRQMQRIYLAKISTVHSFCTDVLREYAYESNLPGDFRVGDENECSQLRIQAMEETLESAYATRLGDPDFRAFVDTQGLGRSDLLVPKIVMKVYDSARCHLDPEKWLDHCLKSADLTQVEDAAQTVWGAYLMADLKQYLAMQINAMSACLDMARNDGEMPKPEALLTKILTGITELSEARTWDQVLERKNIDFGRLTFTKKADPDTAERIKVLRSDCKDGLEKRLRVFCDPSQQVLADLGQTSAAIRGLVGLARDFGKRYQALKERRRVLDFSDLEHKTLDLLVGKHRSAPTAIAREVGQRFREVLVDEYQDSNAVQDAIFSALTQQRQNCFMVGDVKQSIYQFRLADPGIFLEKYHTYADAEQAQPGEGRKILLSRNFRSGGAVLEAANDVFRRCMTQKVGGLDYGDAEALVEGIPHEPLGEPEVELHVIPVGEDTYGQEAAYVADRIAQLLDGHHMIRGKEGLRPIEAEDIAILLRSPGSVGQTYQDALALRGIRSAFGSGRDLLQTGEVSLIRSLLQVISNPRQDIPLLATLASPVFGFTADDLARIRGQRRYGDFYGALFRDTAPKSAEFMKLLGELRSLAKMERLSTLVEHIFCKTRLESIYAAMDSGAERVANLREFYRIVMDFESASGRDLSQFLEHLELMEEKGLTISEPGTGGAVQILSIHKSKGLEYPVVFLSALSRGFNREDLRAQVLCDGELGLGLSAVDSATRVRYPTIAKRAIVAHASRESLSEELRVLYVAMTRAKDRLIMTYAEKNPEKTLAQIALSIEPGGIELLAGQVASPGEWVLMEAMCRTEAGQLFAAADARPDETHMGDHPWLIRFAEPAAPVEGELPAQTVAEPQLPQNAVEKLRVGLAFRYPHTPATQTPSKQTATQLKGRQKDAEVSEQAKPVAFRRTWRKLTGTQTDGKDYGNVMHTLMQYLRFDQCDTPEGVEGEVRRLTEAGFLTEEQSDLIDRPGVEAFFRTELGKRVIAGQTLREFKFSILDRAEAYGDGLEGEQILLQGVVDCALIEPEGITIVDFKTDRVSKDGIEKVKSRYRDQVSIYANALERIYELPVRKRYLYLFHLRELVEL